MSVMHTCDTIRKLPTMPGRLISTMPKHEHPTIQAAYRVRRVSKLAYQEAELCIPCFQHLMKEIAADPGMIPPGAGYEVTNLRVV